MIIIVSFDGTPPTAVGEKTRHQYRGKSTSTNRRRSIPCPHSTLFTTYLFYLYGASISLEFLFILIFFVFFTRLAIHPGPGLPTRYFYRDFQDFNTSSRSKVDRFLSQKIYISNYK